MLAAARAGARSATSVSSCAPLRRLARRPRSGRRGIAHSVGERRGAPPPPHQHQAVEVAAAARTRDVGGGMSATTSNGRPFTTTTTVAASADGGAGRDGSEPPSIPGLDNDSSNSDSDSEGDVSSDSDSDSGDDSDADSDAEARDEDMEDAPTDKRDLRVLPVRGEATGGRFSRFGPGRELGEFDPVREAALESMYPSLVPSEEELLDDSHMPVLKDPFAQKGRIFRCKGKKQGKGALPGTCEIFNVKQLHINNTMLLKEFLNEGAAILPRHVTGLCAKCSRKVSRTIKHARQAGLIPTVNDFLVRDTGPGGLRAWATGETDADTKALRNTVPRPMQKRFGSL